MTYAYNGVSKESSQPCRQRWTKRLISFTVTRDLADESAVWSNYLFIHRRADRRQINIKHLDHNAIHVHIVYVPI